MDSTLLQPLLDWTTETFNSSLPGITITLLGSTIASVALFVRGRIEWQRAKFESRINISLNTVSGGVLRIRTLLEDEVKNVVLSSYARRLLKKAAKKTTLEDPFLLFVSRRDAWMVYNELVNAISGLYSAQILSAAIHGTGAIEERFLIALTWERDADIRIQKLRVLVIQESVLRKLGDDIKLKPEIPAHLARIGALKKMRQQLLYGSSHRCQAVLSLPQRT
jgi:hypothetical protein